MFPLHNVPDKHRLDQKVLEKKRKNRNYCNEPFIIPNEDPVG